MESTSLPTLTTPDHSAPSRKPSLHDPLAMKRFRREQRVEPDVLRRMQYLLYRLGTPVEEALQRLGPAAAQAAQQAFDLEPLRLIERYDSKLDQSAKLVMETHDGLRIETVLLRASTSRTSVCVSTQVGCQAGCTFCATARMGLKRNLTRDEILEQVLIAGRIARQEGKRIRNIVFMGMGEPLHNELELHAALDKLFDPLGFGYAPKRITVSTVGFPGAMMRLADRFPGIQVALSLHSAKPELRAKLVPWARQHDWHELRNALKDVANRPIIHRHQVVMIEHLMLSGVNDSAADAAALIEYLEGIPSIVNLIPYNPIPFAPNWEPTSREQRGEFSRLLRAAGIFTTIRYSMGSDVNAACGQLVQNLARTPGTRSSPKTP